MLKTGNLTQKERAWLVELETVMARCPTRRMHCYTTGDNDLTFYDKRVSDAWEKAHPHEQLDAGELHARAGSELARVVGNFNIDSCAG
jgi:hypothetical protein